MKIDKILKITLLLSSFLGVCFAQDYRFVSGPQGGNWFVLGGAIASHFSSDGLKTTSSAGGGVSNVINVNNKKADIGFSVGSLLGAAVKGEGNFKTPIKDTVVLANLYPQVTYFIARADFVKNNNIKTLGDALRIKKLRIASLKPGTSSEFIVSAILKLGYDTDWKAIKNNGGGIQFVSYSDGADLISDNHIDLLAFSVGEVASIIMNIESQTNITILPIEEEVLQKVSNAYGTSTYTIKPGIYKSVTTQIPTVGDFNVLVVNKNLPAKTAESMVKSLMKHQRELSSTVKDFESFNAKNAISNTLPMHSAAKEYFESISK